MVLRRATQVKAAMNVKYGRGDRTTDFIRMRLKHRGTISAQLRFTDRI